MKKTLFGLLAGALFACFATAGDVELRPDHPDEYVVVRGDTLWDISGRFLQKPWLWPNIWKANPQISNPDLIYPGDRITLVYIGGEPYLMLNRGAGGTVKLSPEVRSSPLAEAIPAIPLEDINAFLSRSRVVEDGQLESSAYVVAGASRHVITGAGDELHARGSLPEGEVNFGIFRDGGAIADPESKEVLGRFAREIGAARLLDVEGEISTFTVNRSREEIRGGDRLLPVVEQKITATFFPSAPAATVSGVILAVENGVNQIGALDVVVINRGTREGLVDGNVLAINKRGEQARDPVTGKTLQMPDSRAGLLMVFRTFEKLSFAIVLESNQPLAVLDKIGNP
jgi:hypothetical protein